MEQKDIEYLLSKVSGISRKYDEIAKVTGENFNIFSIMNMEHNEVKTHSSIIGEFLNPNGRHGLQDKLLELFIETLKNKFRDSPTMSEFVLDAKTSFVTIEKYIGVINQDKTVGGRIDIFIQDSKREALIIENKVYANEQENQLIRYNNYLKTAPILYLTLFGEQPKSHGELIEKKDYFNVSYEKFIVEWLEKCLKEATMLPMLREVIKQYMNLVKKMTFQSTNHIMNKEILDAIIEKPENVKSIFEISNNIAGLQGKLYKNLIERISDTNGFTVVETENEKYFGIDVKHENVDRVISVLFGKKKSNYDSVFCGFLIDDNLSKDLKDKYISHKYEVDNEWVFKWLKNYKWENNPVIWEDISKGDKGETYKEIQEIIQEIIDIEKFLKN